MFYTNLNNPNKQRIDRMFGNTLSKAEENALLVQAYEGINALTKSDELGILSFDGNDIEKGRKAMPIGSHATWSGVDYLKTASGWKPVGKTRGQVKSNHDHIHNNAETDKDHHEMTMDAGKMTAEEWGAKHGSKLHAKYKEVHDYLHKEKVEKLSDEDLLSADKSIKHWIDKYEGEIKSGNKSIEDLIKETKSLIEENDKNKNDVGYAKKNKILNGLLDHFDSKESPSKNKAGFNNGDDHGIETGGEYKHENYGNVKVTKVEKNTSGDKEDSISHHVTFTHKHGTETQGINGFRHDTTGDYNGKPQKIDSNKLFDENGATEAGKNAYKEALEKFKPDSQQAMNSLREHVFGADQFYNTKLADSLTSVKNEYWKNKDLAGDHAAKPKSELDKKMDAEELKVHGENLKPGDKVVVYPGHKELEHKGTVVNSNGNNGVQVKKDGSDNHAGTVYDRKDLKSVKKHEADDNGLQDKLDYFKNDLDDSGKEEYIKTLKEKWIPESEKEAVNKDKSAAWNKIHAGNAEFLKEKLLPAIEKIYSESKQLNNTTDFVPDKKAVNKLVSESLKHYNSVPPNEQSKLKKIVEEGVDRYKNSLKDYTIEDYNAPFPTGDSRKEMKTKLEAGKLFLKKIA